MTTVDSEKAPTQAILVFSLSACVDSGNYVRTCIRLRKGAVDNGVTFEMAVRISLLAMWRLCEMRIGGLYVSSPVVELLLTHFRAEFRSANARYAAKHEPR